MKTYNFSIALKALTFLFLTSAILSCNSNNKKGPKDDPSVTSITSELMGSIPNSIVQYLITSASNDFSNHQPPLPIDFRNVKVGYLISPNNEKTFILCGEFLSQEKMGTEEWENFATIKTSGYEQYIGNQALSFCQKATMALTDEANLSVELKNKLVELRKQK